MATLTNIETLVRWVGDNVLHAELVPGRSYRGGTVRADAEGLLVYHRTSADPTVREVGDEYQLSGRTVVARHRHSTGGRRGFGPVVLGRWIRGTRTFLLNGDGFLDQAAERWQTGLRQFIQQGELWNAGERIRLAPRTHNARPFRHVIVPYLALVGAEVDPTTVRTIDVTADRWEEVVTVVPTPPTEEEWEAMDPPVTSPGAWQRHRTVVKDGVSFRITETMTSRWVDAHGQSQQPEVRDANGLWTRRTDLTKEEVWTIRRAGTGSPVHPFSVEALIRTVNNRRRWLTVRRGEDADFLSTFTTAESVHRLGASLFSAVGEDGRRHKFVSAFDMGEPQPMYFLAQLPDRSGARTYEQAIDALAPEIVHRAWREEREVHRQGDIFAIETKLKDEDLYPLARTRVRRAVALFAYDDNWLVSYLHGGEGAGKQAPPGEVLETVTCPCDDAKCSRSRRVPWGPRAKRALSIYRTGHTASEVLVTRKGVVYVRGTMHHDPQIEEPGRRSEHVEVPMDDKTWFLTVRNTVPRRRRRTATEGGEV